MSDRSTAAPVVAEMPKQQALETRMRLETEGLATTSRLRNLYSSLRDTLFRTVTSEPGCKRLDGLAESLSRLGMISELDDLDELMQANRQSKRTGTSSKWYVDRIPRCRMETHVARRDYKQAGRRDLSKTEGGVLLRGAIFQGDLDDAQAILHSVVSRRESTDENQNSQTLYFAGRLAVAAHWRENNVLRDWALQLMQCLLENKDDASQRLPIRLIGSLPKTVSNPTFS